MTHHVAHFPPPFWWQRRRRKAVPRHAKGARRADPAELRAALTRATAAVHTNRALEAEAQGVAASVRATNSSNHFVELVVGLLSGGGRPA